MDSDQPATKALGLAFEKKVHEGQISGVTLASQYGWWFRLEVWDGDEHASHTFNHHGLRCLRKAIDEALVVAGEHYESARDEGPASGWPDTA